MKWLKWILISVGGVILLLGIAIAAFIFWPRQPNQVTQLSGNWVVEHYWAWNPDGHAQTYLARQNPGEKRKRFARVLGYEDIGDDCVVFATWDSSSYVVCGDRPALFIANSHKMEINADPIILREQSVTRAELKRAALNVSEDKFGGDWVAQKEAFPYPGSKPGYVLFFKDRKGRYTNAVQGYRYIGDQCVLFFFESWTAGVKCGGHDDAFIGEIDRGSSILDDPVRIEGKALAVDEIRKYGLSREKQVSHDLD